MIVRNKKSNSSNWRLPGAFRMTLQNFRMIMRNQLWDSPLVCSTTTLWSILHSYAKWKYLIFPFLSFEFTSTTSKSPPNLGPSALILPHHPHYLLSLIPFLFYHSMLQKSPWNISKTSQKPLVSLTRATMYYLGILGIITTQKVWNSWELLFKMCCFLVVINYTFECGSILYQPNFHLWARVIPIISPLTKRSLDMSSSR